MADSREHTQDNNGRMVKYNDNQEKITPAQNSMVFAQAGLGKVHLGDGRYYDLYRLTEYFIQQNESILNRATSKQLLEGLVMTWNRALSEKIGRNPFRVENRFSLLLASFENENGERKPKIHTYQSHLREYQYNGRKAVVRDDSCYPIITPYFQTDTDGWSFDETLEFYLKGYAEVMEKVETVGGSVDIYVLEKSPENSYWLKRKDQR